MAGLWFLLACLWVGLAFAQSAPMPKIGVLYFDELRESFRDGLRRGLIDNGYVEGKSVQIEWRAADGQMDRATRFAAELVRLKVDVIVATPTPAVQAAKNATRTIPIVMAPAGDPVASGLVKSLARPEGNITGVNSVAAELGGKLLDVLRELKPQASRVAVLTDPYSVGREFIKQVESTASVRGVVIVPVVADRLDDIASAFKVFGKNPVDALIVLPRHATKQVAELAAQYRLPSITTGSFGSEFVDLGGLVYYGPGTSAQLQQAAGYVAKILRGARPGDLPIEQPRTFEFVLNLKTAKALGINVPQATVLRADRIVE
jgi:putative ABC transport system substrate-binding protein